MRAFGIATDVREAVESGACCTECSAEFVQSHGHPTLCHYCWLRLDPKARRGLQLAIHDETAVHHGKQASRARRETPA